MEKELTPQWLSWSKNCPSFWILKVHQYIHTSLPLLQTAKPLNIIKTLSFGILKMEVTWAKIREVSIPLGQMNLILKILNISRVRFWQWICSTDESSGSNSKSYIYCNYQYFGPTELQTVWWCSTNWRQNVMTAIYVSQDRLESRESMWRLYVPGQPKQN